MPSYAALKQHYSDKHPNVRWPAEFDSALTAETETESYRSTLHPNRQSHTRLWIGVLLISVILLGSAGWYFYSSSATQANVAAELLSGSPPPVLGVPTAQVTIVQFGDFQCPSCGEWYRSQEPQIVQNLVQSGKAKLEWRDFDYYDPDSVTASEAAYAAGEQGKFWQMYNLLYSNQQTPNSGWANKASVESYAQQLGLNMNQFNAVLSENKYQTVINANYQLGTSLGVTGTPTFFVLGQSGKSITIVGDQPYSVFQTAFDSLTAT
jgi:protein-disulfide isomerase